MIADLATLIRTARERIDQCRAVEAKFLGAQATAAHLRSTRDRAGKGRRDYTDPPPQAAVEAWTERMVWRRVLDLLGVVDAPVSEEMRHAAAEQDARDGGAP